MRTIPVLFIFSLMLPSLARAADTAPAPSGDTTMSAAPTFVVAKWQARLYGFAEADSFLDSTQSLVDLQGNQLLAAPSSSAGQSGRFQESARNSRFGIALESPEFNGMKSSGIVEMDFLGFDTNPGTAAGTATSNSEATFYNGAFRLRHAWARLSTRYVDITAGQNWTLFGWNPVFTPGSVSLQGLPGEIYQRTMQIRLSHVFDLDVAKVEIAGAAVRPYQRDSSLPGWAGGVRLEFPGWEGFKSTGVAAGGFTSLQFGFTAEGQEFRALGATPANPTDYETAAGTGFAFDALIPIIPASKGGSKANALTFVGEASSGSGDSDTFTSLTGGATIGIPKGGPTTYTVTPSLDAGPAGFGSDTGALETVDWKSLLLNLQYYTPILDGAVWINGLYSVVTSDNIGLFAKRGNAFFNEKYGSVGLFVDPTPSFRIGAEGQWTRQQMTDNSVRVNRRAQLTFVYMFL